MIINLFEKNKSNEYNLDFEIKEISNYLKLLNELIFFYNLIINYLEKIKNLEFKNLNESNLKKIVNPFLYDIRIRMKKLEKEEILRKSLNKIVGELLNNYLLKMEDLYKNKEYDKIKSLNFYYLNKFKELRKKIKERIFVIKNFLENSFEEAA